MHFDDIVSSTGDHQVILSYDGEGLNGDYGEADDDQPLVRYTIYYKDEPIQDGSACTSYSWHTDRDTLTRVANKILEIVVAENVTDRISHSANQQLWAAS
jgi:hypothetical protein